MAFLHNAVHKIVIRILLNMYLMCGRCCCCCCSAMMIDKRVDYTHGVSGFIVILLLSLCVFARVLCTFRYVVYCIVVFVTVWLLAYWNTMVCLIQFRLIYTLCATRLPSPALSLPLTNTMVTTRNESVYISSDVYC